jgi:twitching motility protein PilT
MNLLQIDPESPTGQRFKELSQDPRVSDFYLTANEPLAYKSNGQMVYDHVVYEFAVPDFLEPGCADSAIDLHGRRYRVSQMVTKGKLRWVLRLLPNVIPEPGAIKVPPSALKAFLEACFSFAVRRAVASRRPSPPWCCIVPSAVANM